MGHALPPQRVEPIGISSQTKRPHAASLAQDAAFSLAENVPVDYHV